MLLFIMLATLAIGLALFQVGSASVLRSDAQTAADAAALAGVRNVRDQLNRQFASSGTTNPELINPAELEAATRDYAARNDAELLTIQRLGVDVRVTVRTQRELGEPARPVDAEHVRGGARARASMVLSATSVPFGLGGGGSPGGPVTGTPSFSDEDFEKLADEVGDPPFNSDDIVAVGRFLQRHGLAVAEHPEFGGVADVHSHYGVNDHYNGGAIDVNSPAGDQAEIAPFDELKPKLQELGFQVLWRVAGHAPGDNSHMHVDIGPGGQGGGGGGASIFGPGASGDVLSEIRLVTWEGAPTSLELSGPGGNPLGPPDMDVACEIYRVGRAKDVSDKVMLSAFEAAIVESGVHNLNYGDRDSHGVFQQRWSVGAWGTLAETMDVTHASHAYFNAALREDHGQPAGVLAQDVQGSAYPERYAEREGQALALIERVKRECGDRI